MREAFVRLYREGLITRGEYMVNWSPVLEHRRLRPRGRDRRPCRASSTTSPTRSRASDERIVVATTRPETMLGDTARRLPPRRRALPPPRRPARRPAARRPAAAVRRRRRRWSRSSAPAWSRSRRSTTRSTSSWRGATACPAITVIDRHGRMTAEAGRGASPASTASRRARRVVERLRERGLPGQGRGPRPQRRPQPAQRRADRAAGLDAVVLRRRRAWRRRRSTAVRDGRLRAGARDLGEDLGALAGEHQALVHLAPALVGAPDPGLVRRGRAAASWRTTSRRRRAPGRHRPADPGPRRARHLVLLGASGRSRPSAGRRTPPTCAPSIRPTCWSPASTSSSSGWRGW